MRVQIKWEVSFVIQKIYVQNKREAAFGLLISIILLKYIYYELYENFREICFLNGCSLVYLANYIKLLRTATFELIINY